MKIQDKIAVITGGASGLGAASAWMILEAGGKAVIVDLNRDLGEALQAELGERSLFVTADVADPEQMEAAVRAALDRFGGIHFLINCAGTGDAGRVVGKDGPMPLDRFTRIVRINLIGTFNSLRLAAAAMMSNEPDEEGERGVIVNTASVAAFEGQIGQAAYSASKGGIVGMTLPIAREFARYGIRVMTIAPGLFDTPLLAGLPVAARQSLGESVPFPARLGRPSEYAMLARHIIENPMLNGEVVRLDGAIRMAPK